MLKAITWNVGPDGVGHGVAPQHCALGHALEAGHLDVVALEHLDRRRPHDPRDVRDDDEHQREHREHQPVEVRPRRLAGADARGGREDVPDVGREQHDQQQPERRSPGSEASTRVAVEVVAVERLVPLGGGVGADGDARSGSTPRRRTAMRNSEFQMRSPSTSITGRPLVNDTPGSPVSSPLNQSQYCVDQRLVEAELLLLGRDRLRGGPHGRGSPAPGPRAPG